MDVKSKIEIKDEPLEGTEDNMPRDFHSVEDSGGEERLERYCYQNIDVKCEIDIVNDDLLDYKEENAMNGQCFEQISELEESQHERNCYPDINVKSEIEVKEEPFDDTEERDSENDHIDVKDEPLDVVEEETSNDPLSEQTSRLKEFQKLKSCMSLNNKRKDLQNILERNLNKRPHSDDVTISIKRIREYEKEISDQRKKIKLLESKVEFCERQHSNFAGVDGAFRSLVEETFLTCKNSQKKILEKITSSHEKLLEKIQEIISNNRTMPAQIGTTANSKTFENKEIVFGSVAIPEKAFYIISKREKHSLFIKDLTTLLWDEEELMNKSVSGKKWLKSEESRLPLTPEKLIAIKAAFRERLLKLNYDEFTSERELKFMNRYIAEKICDLRKSKKLKKTLSLDENVTTGSVQNGETEHIHQQN